MRNKNLSILILSAALLAALIGLWIARQPTQGEVVGQCSVQAEKFVLRVTAKREIGIIMPVPGTYYTYEYQLPATDGWHTIAIFRHDDEIKDPCSQINSLNSSTTTFFIGWIYGVTTDSGKTWSIWNAETDLAAWQPVDYQFIRSIHIDKDGMGVMLVNTEKFPSGQLVTEDYGKTWKSAQNAK